MVVYCDGGTNKHGVYWSVMIEDGYTVDRPSIRRKSKHYTTNNEAEYMALCDALGVVASYTPCDCLIQCDSQLIVRQMEGRYQVKEPRLKPLHDRAKRLMTVLSDKGFAVNIRWVPRKEIVTRLGH